MRKEEIEKKWKILQRNMEEVWPKKEREKNVAKEEGEE